MYTIWITEIQQHIKTNTKCVPTMIFQNVHHMYLYHQQRYCQHKTFYPIGNWLLFRVITQRFVFNFDFKAVNFQFIIFLSLFLSPKLLWGLTKVKAFTRVWLVDILNWNNIKRLALLIAMTTHHWFLLKYNKTGK